MHFRLAFDNIEHTKLGAHVQIQNIIEWLSAPSINDLFEFISSTMRQSISQLADDTTNQNPRSQLFIAFPVLHFHVVVNYF